MFEEHWARVVVLNLFKSEIHFKISWDLGIPLSEKHTQRTTHQRLSLQLLSCPEHQSMGGEEVPSKSLQLQNQKNHSHCQPQHPQEGEHPSRRQSLNYALE